MRKAMIPHAQKLAWLYTIFFRIQPLTIYNIQYIQIYTCIYTNTHAYTYKHTHIYLHTYIQRQHEHTLTIHMLHTCMSSKRRSEVQKSKPIMKNEVYILCMTNDEGTWRDNRKHGEDKEKKYKPCIQLDNPSLPSSGNTNGKRKQVIEAWPAIATSVQFQENQRLQ